MMPAVSPPNGSRDGGGLARALTLIARVRLDEPRRRELEALFASVDLATLADGARRHALVPLLWRHLQPSGAGAADERQRAVRAAVEREALEIATWSLSETAELVSVVGDLRAAGVEALSIKGPISAATCYGDVGLRTFSDLDLLVRPAEVEIVSERLTARGYRPRFSLSPAWRERLLRNNSELLFQHEDGQRLIDVHWSLLRRGYSFTPEADGLFAVRRLVRLGARTVSTLGPEATLLFLLLHGAKHQWHRLAWLCDVAELLRAAPDLDWAAVGAWSSKPGRRRLVDVGLTLASTLLDAPVPEPLLAASHGDPAVGAIAASLGRRLFAPVLPAAGLFERIFRPDYLRSMTLTRDRARFLHDVVLRPTVLEWQALPLPPALAPFHYGFRPARLLWRAWRRYAGAEGRRSDLGERR